ncbi:MAG TPA: hypothetical protein VJ801_12735 [Polyangia bacterium]|jgi:hypothetical protein|nr:hypothetical protein [Polyangia bacterium]
MQSDHDTDADRLGRRLQSKVHAPPHVGDDLLDGFVKQFPDSLGRLHVTPGVRSRPVVQRIEVERRDRIEDLLGGVRPPAGDECSLWVLGFHILKDVAPRDRTWLAGLANGVLQLGMLSVSLFGALANHTGFTLVFVVAGALVAASSVLLVPAALRRLVRGRSLSTEMLSPPG